MPDPQRGASKLTDIVTGTSSIADINPDLVLPTGERVPAGSRNISGEDFQPGGRFTDAKAPGFLDLAASFAGGLVHAVNPLPMLAALYNHGDILGGASNVAKGMTQAQIAQFSKAQAAFKDGRVSEAIGHTLAGVLPVVGPAAADAGEQIGSGDATKMAEGAGSAVGLAAPFAASTVIPKVADATAGAARAVGAQGLADRLASSKLTDVMVPKVGPQKVRFGNMAADVAPDLAREPGLGAISRSGFAAKVGERLESAQQALDAAADARNAGHAIDTAPIIADLQAKLARLQAEPVEGTLPNRVVGSRQSPVLGPDGKPIMVETQTAVPLGEAVTPGPNGIRAAQIQQAIGEIQQLGPMARYEALRRIRQSYDGPAKAVYNPSLAQDYMAKMGEKNGAADVTGTLRGHLADADPATAAANAQYSLYKSASDVLQATEEAQRTRPTVARRIFAGMAGSIGGNALAGPVGGAIGAVVAPIIDAAVSSGLTTQITTSRLLAKVADALAKNQTAAARVALSDAAKSVGKWSQLNSTIAAAFQDMTATGAASQAPTSPSIVRK